MAALPPVGLESLYPGWGDYQELLVAALAPLQPAQLDIRARPESWSVRIIASHIVAARAWWFHAWMGEGGPEFDLLNDFDEGPESLIRPAAELVRGLEASWILVRSSLRRWTPADLEAEFQRPVPNAAGERPLRSRGWILYHVLEHDAFHGGEISFALGTQGLPGIDL